LFDQEQPAVEGNLTFQIAAILGLPERLAYVAEEFVTVRLQTNKGKTDSCAVRPPTAPDLVAYGVVLKDQLDSYARFSHSLTFSISQEFVACEIDSTPSGDREITVHEQKQRVVDVEIWNSLRATQSQWVYVQRGLRVFEGDKLYLYKPKRLLDWTRTQALVDSDEIISDVLSHVGGGGRD
jgi:hypothetical protein